MEAEKEEGQTVGAGVALQQKAQEEEGDNYAKTRWNRAGW